MSWQARASLSVDGFFFEKATRMTLRRTDSRGLLTLLMPPCDPRGHDLWCATEAMPGSPEKMAILSERIRNGLPLFHPQDRGTRDLRWHHEDEL